MGSLSFEASGAARTAVEVHIGTLVADKVASRIAAKDRTLWGPAAESEAAIRLGWVEAAEVSRPLVGQILQLRDELRADGVSRIVLAGMGGSSLAPEVIANTAGVELTVLDSTDPEQVAAALVERLDETALVVSSKSGSTVETDSQRRIFEQAFTAAGLDAASRIIVVTDPGSPMDQASREAGYRAVFNADPNVGGRYSALTAFGLVPTGLAGVDIEALLDDAEEAAEILADDAPENIGLALGAVLGGTSPLRDKVVIIDEGSGIVGFADWAEQLVAESTGKSGTGLLPVVANAGDPETSWNEPDVLLVRLCSPTAELQSVESGANQVVVSGSLGSQLLLWEYATVVAGRLLGINPFDQPDVEAAKVAARGLLEARPETQAPAFTDGAVQVIADAQLLDGAETLEEALRTLLRTLAPNGYLSVQAYLDRFGQAELAGLRPQLAKLAHRPVTFGWGPRFLHSTGQFHKGGPAVGSYLQITADSATDLQVPDRPFSLGQLITAQAAGDAQVLADHGRPVVRLHLTDRRAGTRQLGETVARLGGKG
ncbi:glucose-6-phosphate isomerase [Arthrobacter sp. I2-34]|uniref:Glucose-6-phosphate isomerase n=1 Tax=Arthrobacter hankyongi TaxID=2904801 RepID=A0ABS9L6E3_9MICC|nr:glucose-6-phosphate isomerase [Arthrobacter hankyongi]MCG2622064.1 glucose-6-phosphate isomerase [Arthrobacter hankyongi]